MTEPYYADEHVTLYHGDCREVDEWRTADVVVTDPPYGMGYYASDKVVLTGERLAEWVEHFAAVAVFGYPERLVGLCVAAGVVPAEWVTWWASNAAIKAFSLSALLMEAECVATFGPHRFRDLRQARTASSRRIIDSALVRVGDGGRMDTDGDPETRRLGDVWTDAADGLAFQHANRLHPNQKPLPVMSRLVEGLTTEAQTVADPFAGSGSTLVAAKSLGRRAIGVEVVEEHCETIVKRCAQGALFGGAA